MIVKYSDQKLVTPPKVWWHSAEPHLSFNTKQQRIQVFFGFTESNFRTQRKIGIIVTQKP